MAPSTSSSKVPYMAADTTTTTKEPPMMVHVTAPATLPAGYTFEAEINGDPAKLFTCEVPEGGVEEGQLFLAPLSNKYDGPRLLAPTGRWKDGLCDCVQHDALGLCHASLCCSLCCTPLAMGQVMTRMQVTWLGDPGPLNRTRQTCTVVVALVVAYFIFSIALELAALPYGLSASDEAENYTTSNNSNDTGAADWINYMRLAGNLLFTAWAVIALARTRATVRARYQIPVQAGCRGEGGGVWEDVCCSLWCTCCVTAQLLRHTGEYEHYAGTCCSATGHPPGTPLVV